MNLGAFIGLLLLFTPVKEDIPSSVYDFKIEAFKGAEIDLADFKGKKILIVNTPCTSLNDPQYAELEALSKKYSGKLVVIGVLSADYNIAPGTKPVDYHKMRYKVSFPLADKQEVAGKEISPLFQWLAEKKYNNFKENHVKWNFQKYLINEEGKLIAVFDPKVKPLSRQVTNAIEQ